MRIVKIGDKGIGVRATPLALLYYKQEFGSDLIGDLIKFQDLMADPSKLDSVTFLQMTWAMAKANEGVGKKFPDFYNWVAELDSFDITDDDVLFAIIEEAEKGFFRSAGQKRGE